MRQPDLISKDGFSSSKPNARLGLAFTALHLALRAYCGSAYALRGRLYLAEPGKDANEQERYDANLGWEYERAAYQTIVHLQHFVELVVKQALRDDHELLVVVAGEQHDLLHRLLHGDSVASDAAEKTKTIEFSEALRRCCELLQSGRLKSTGYQHLLGARNFLEQLNGLRNRLWHRGTFVLRYNALDELVGGYGLQFVFDTVSQGTFSGGEREWMHSPLACGLHPLRLIRDEMSTAKPSRTKVAFLKELARAAFENPLIDIPGWFDQQNKTASERANAAARHDESDVYAVYACPTCGVSAHVVYMSWTDGPDDSQFVHTYKSRCFCCGLELRSEYENPSVHGFADMQELWIEV